MGIRLVPKNPFVEEQHYCYAEWAKIHDFMRKHCGHLFTEEEIRKVWWSDGLKISKRKATEVSLLLVELESASENGDTSLDSFYKFCRDSHGFTIK